MLRGNHSSLPSFFDLFLYKKVAWSPIYCFTNKFFLSENCEILVFWISKASSANSRTLLSNVRKLSFNTCSLNTSVHPPRFELNMKITPLTLYGVSWSKSFSFIYERVLSPLWSTEYAECLQQEEKEAYTFEEPCVKLELEGNILESFCLYLVNLQVNTLNLNISFSLFRWKIGQMIGWMWMLFRIYLRSFSH